MRTYPYISEKYTEELIDLEQMKTWLRMDIVAADDETFEGDDDLIKALILSAIDYVETETNLSLGESEYEWNTDCFPEILRDTFYIKEVTSITGTSSDPDVTIDPVNYRLVRESKRRVKIKWVDGFYSQYRSIYDGYKISFIAGFATGKIPPVLIMAVRALVAGWYDNRDDYVAEKKTLADKLIAGHVIPYA